jgi:hypothetical protein
MRHSTRYRNVKTGRVYTWIAVATDATNSRDGQRAVVYMGEKGDWFVREEGEFKQKFVEAEE